MSDRSGAPPRRTPAEPEPEPVPPRVTRHIQPLGPRVLVRLLRVGDRTEAGLYLPQGAKEAQSESLYGEVVEVARTQPNTPFSTEDDEDDGEEIGLGKNVSGVPPGSHVLFSKDRGISVPWDDSLRIVDVRHVLAIIEVISQEEIQ